MVFMKLTLQEYIDSCYKIVGGLASKKELPKEERSLTIQLCLAHTMKIFSFHINKYLPKCKTFIIIACSLIANSETIGEFKEAVSD